MYRCCFYCGHNLYLKGETKHLWHNWTCCDGLICCKVFIFFCIWLCRFYMMYLVLINAHGVCDTVSCIPPFHWFMCCPDTTLTMRSTWGPLSVYYVIISGLGGALFLPRLVLQAREGGVTYQKGAGSVAVYTSLCSHSCRVYSGSRRQPSQRHIFIKSSPKHKALLSKADKKGRWVK